MGNYPKSLLTGLGSFIFLVLMFSSTWALALSNEPTLQDKATLLLKDSNMGPSTCNDVRRGIACADTEKARLVILQVDTPGNLDKSIRGIIKWQFDLPWSLIITLAVINVAFYTWIFLLILQSKRKQISCGQEALLQSSGIVMSETQKSGMMLVKINGEIWNARSTQPFKEGELVKVIAVDGLTVQVERAD